MLGSASKLSIGRVEFHTRSRAHFCAHEALPKAFRLWCCVTGSLGSSAGMTLMASPPAFHSISCRLLGIGYIQEQSMSGQL
jgi:hypothetical protein